jgi:hypothetical protein
VALRAWAADVHGGLATGRTGPRRNNPGVARHGQDQARKARGRP